MYLSLAAGTFMYANSVPQHTWPYPGCLGERHETLNLTSYGYPYPFEWTWIDGLSKSKETQSFFFSWSVVVNVIVGLIALTLLALCCEWSLRRAERIRAASVKLVSAIKT